MLYKLINVLHFVGVIESLCFIEIQQEQSYSDGFTMYEVKYSGYPPVVANWNLVANGQIGDVPPSSEVNVCPSNSSVQKCSRLSNQNQYVNHIGEFRCVLSNGCVTTSASFEIRQYGMISILFLIKPCITHFKIYLQETPVVSMNYQIIKPGQQLSIGCTVNGNQKSVISFEYFPCLADASIEFPRNCQQNQGIKLFVRV